MVVQKTQSACFNKAGVIKYLNIDKLKSYTPLIHSTYALALVLNEVPAVASLWAAIAAVATATVLAVEWLAVHQRAVEHAFVRITRSRTRETSKSNRSCPSPIAKFAVREGACYSVAYWLPATSLTTGGIFETVSALAPSTDDCLRCAGRYAHNYTLGPVLYFVQRTCEER